MAGGLRRPFPADPRCGRRLRVSAHAPCSRSAAPWSIVPSLAPRGNGASILRAHSRSRARSRSNGLPRSRTHANRAVETSLGGTPTAWSHRTTHAKESAANSVGRHAAGRSARTPSWCTTTSSTRAGTFAAWEQPPALCRRGSRGPPIGTRLGWTRSAKLPCPEVSLNAKLICQST